MTSTINKQPTLNAFRMVKGFCTAPKASFHKPKPPAAVNVGNNSQATIPA